jgi:hypothetical protein
VYVPMRPLSRAVAAVITVIWSFLCAHDVCLPQTGYSALNKLLGREVYTSQDQLGGPQIMAPNGVSHLVRRFEGICLIIAVTGLMV